MMPAFRRRVSVTGPFRMIPVAAGLALALLAPTLVEAQDLEPSLTYMLPVYCRYTQYFRDRMPGGNNRAEIDRWTELMGDTFNHMHHYCLGLMASNRAAFLSNTPEDRKHNLGVSIKEFDYVIDRAPANFSMLPEILTKKGESLIQLDRPGEGIVELEQAIRIKADYSPAYAAMSDYYKGAGQLAKAHEWLQKGLSEAPNSPALMRRLAALDGRKDKGKTSQGPERKPAAP